MKMRRVKLTGFHIYHLSRSKQFHTTRIGDLYNIIEVEMVEIIMHFIRLIDH